MGWVVRVASWLCFTPEERVHCSHWIGGWVGPRAGLDTEVKGKVLLPLPGIEPRSPGLPVRSQALYWLRFPGSVICYWYVGLRGNLIYEVYCFCRIYVKGWEFVYKLPSHINSDFVTASSTAYKPFLNEKRKRVFGSPSWGIAWIWKPLTAGCH
jgi:hypothetical protein